MRWALAFLGSLGRFEPVGFWIDTEWAAIRKELEGRLDYDKLEVLFSDGGPGIEEKLFHLAMKQQRCQWHGKTGISLFFVCRRLQKAEQQFLVDKLKSLPVMTLHPERLREAAPRGSPLSRTDGGARRHRGYSLPVPLHQTGSAAHAAQSSLTRSRKRESPSANKYCLQATNLFETFLEGTEVGGHGTQLGVRDTNGRRLFKAVARDHTDHKILLSDHPLLP
jgi:hypothetical protein